MEGVKETAENDMETRGKDLKGSEENKMILEEKDVKLQNEVNLANGSEKDHELDSNMNTSQTEEKDEGESQKEKMETTCKRFLHLLERSRMYATILNDQVKSQGILNTRKKKSDTSKEPCNDSKSDGSGRKMSRKELVKVAEESKEAEEFLYGDNVDFFEKTRKTRLNFTVSQYQPLLVEGVVMKDYQLKGLQWMSTLFSTGVSGILADEMGLGKTLQAIALICSLIENGIEGPFLVVVPLSTSCNWLREFNNFAPRVPTLFYYGDKNARKRLFHEITKPVTVLGKNVQKVVITSYETALSDSTALSKIMWPYIVVDEGHRLKNHNSQLARALREFNAVGKLLITGTPLQNDLSELWSLLNFIIPEVFNSLEIFQSWLDLQELEGDGSKFMEEKYNVNIISTLQQILMPFLLRREKKDVSLKLPPKKEVLVYCPMTPLQKNFYKATLDRSIKYLLNPKRTNEDVTLLEPLPKRACVMYKQFKSLDPNERNSEEIENWRKNYCSSNELPEDFAVRITMQNPQMQLRKIVNHPYLIQFPLVPGTEQLKIDEDLVQNSGKFLVLDAMLSKLKVRGHKVVIFSTFTTMLDLLEYLLEFRKYNYVRFDGSTKMEDREEYIQQFNSNPDIFVFLISQRAGGLGVNLTGADTIIMYDSDWNPQINLQSQDRCHRIGQTKPVVIYKFCMRGTVDEKIIERGKAKRRLEKLIIQKGKFTKGVQNLTAKQNLVDLQEIKKLLSSVDCDSVIHSNGFVFTDEELDALLDRSDMTEGSSETSLKAPENKKIFQLISSEPGQ